jgi:hypothetical protein
MHVLLSHYKEMSCDDECSIVLHVMQLAVELCERNNKVRHFLFIESDVTHACIECNIVAIQKQIRDILSPIKELSGNNTPLFFLYITLIKKFYEQEVMMSTVSPRKLVRVLTDKLN